MSVCPITGYIFKYIYICVPSHTYAIGSPKGWSFMLLPVRLPWHQARWPHFLPCRGAGEVTSKTTAQVSNAIRQACGVVSHATARLRLTHTQKPPPPSHTLHLSSSLKVIWSLQQQDGRQQDGCCLRWSVSSLWKDQCLQTLLKIKVLYWHLWFHEETLICMEAFHWIL